LNYRKANPRLTNNRSIHNVAGYVAHSVCGVSVVSTVYFLDARESGTFIDLAHQHGNQTHRVHVAAYGEWLYNVTAQQA